jgi:LDH2 family malate/lactate/ureidoglycolate dehydrogenase
VAPIGGHKGFGLAILAEMLTGVLSQGQVIDEPHPVTGVVGVASQTVIVIKPGALMPEAQFRARTSEMISAWKPALPAYGCPGRDPQRTGARSKPRTRSAWKSRWFHP